MRGRKPKPTNLKLLQGNPGHRPINKNEPRPPVVAPDPPEHLNWIALAEWSRVCAELANLGLISQIDSSALAAYCQCYARWVEAEEGVKKSGLIIKTKDGNIIQSPLVGIANTAMKLMHKFLIEFGMTPSCRSRLSGKDADKKTHWADIG